MKSSRQMRRNERRKEMAVEKHTHSGQRYNQETKKWVDVVKPIIKWFGIKEAKAHVKYVNKHVLRRAKNKEEKEKRRGE